MLKKCISFYYTVYDNFTDISHPYQYYNLEEYSISVSAELKLFLVWVSTTKYVITTEITVKNRIATKTPATPAAIAGCTIKFIYVFFLQRCKEILLAALFWS